MRRRTFLGAISAGAAGVLTGGVSKLIAAASPHLRLATASTSEETFLLGGDLLVNRLGFGAMRLTGEGIWGWASISSTPPMLTVRKPTSSSLSRRCIHIRKDW